MNENTKKLTDIEIKYLKGERPFLFEYLRKLSKYDNKLKALKEHSGYLSMAEYSKLKIPFSKDIAEKQFEVNDKYITIYYEGGECEYSIELSRIKTPIELIIWIYHLCGKTWFDKEHVEIFIEKISKIRGFDWDKFC